jgi:hypothetical protein
MKPSPTNSSLEILTYAVFFTFVVVGLGSFVGAFAPLAELLYPVLALATALLLLWRKPGFYLGFMWWVWFLSPEVRRIIDYSTGYTETSLIILTPFLVSGVAIVPALLNVSSLPRSLRFPFALLACALAYAYGVGVLTNSFFGATFDFLNWTVPVISGFYILTQPQHKELFRRVIITTFSWGLLVMGVYGVIQFVYVPPWDGYWMTQALLVDNLNSIGTPEPFLVRVFSTLNAPGPFAIVVMAGLLLLFNNGGVLRYFSLVAGVVGFGLSLVRSAWGGLVVGLIILSASLPLQRRLQLLGGLTVLTLLALPFVTLGPVGEVLSDRFDSFTNLQNDTSFNERLALYRDLPFFIAGNLLGQGLGSTGVATGLNSQANAIQNLDSGIIAVLYSFGLLGSFYFVAGLAGLLWAAFRLKISGDPLHSAALSISVAALSQVVFGNVWTGVSGMVLWFFLCFVLLSVEDVKVDNVQQPLVLANSTIKPSTLKPQL